MRAIIVIFMLALIIHYFTYLYSDVVNKCCALRELELSQLCLSISRTLQ